MAPLLLLLLLFLPTISSAPSTPQTQSNEDEAFISAIISLLSRATVVAELRANDSSMPFEMSITRFVMKATVKETENYLSIGDDDKMNNLMINMKRVYTW
ncbi:hypothetical protein ACMD2_14307 [Ananas comosus]|uniref:Uncharacterized protein n=1 Tax=Ananas comosus TaxID=4615 RepID=A0A199W637_ANACO|nr:hypothetical protein ACMD2_14307 [Ananas comosus]